MQHSHVGGNLSDTGGMTWEKCSVRCAEPVTKPVTLSAFRKRSEHGLIHPHPGQAFGCNEHGSGRSDCGLVAMNLDRVATIVGWTTAAHCNQSGPMDAMIAIPTADDCGPPQLRQIIARIWRKRRHRCGSLALHRPPNLVLARHVLWMFICLLGCV